MSIRIFKNYFKFVAASYWSKQIPGPDQITDYTIAVRTYFLGTMKYKYLAFLYGPAIHQPAFRHLDTL